MIDNHQKRILAGKAYRLFNQEVLRHLSEVQELHAESRDASVLNEIAERMHKVKGGAGFFGLNEMARIAGYLEHSLKDPNLSAEQKRAELDAELSSLKIEAGKMPPPQEPTDA